MNLDDFSYVENDRRYIKPEVSLNEQNAFIDNLRQTQGERNTQIAQQTHNLGKDVTPNLGGLNGGEAYFNARYQTPQTNNLVGELKATAQATALTTALNNELEKAKKRYNDAYYAARARANSTSGSTGSTSDGLNINTNTDSDGKVYVDENQNTGPGMIITDENGMKINNGDGSYTRIRTPNAAESLKLGITADNKPADGTTITRDGITFIYKSKNGQPGWYTVVGKE